MGPSEHPRLANHARLGKDRVTGAAVLLAPETALTLNPTATEVLKLCDGQRSVQEIVKSLADRFDAPEDVLSEDVQQLLDRLVDRGYLVSGPS